MPFFFHNNELGRLAAGCGRRNAGKEKANERIAETLGQARFPSDGAEKIPYHKTFSADIKYGTGSGQEQSEGMQCFYGGINCFNIILAEYDTKGNQH